MPSQSRLLVKLIWTTRLPPSPYTPRTPVPRTHLDTFFDATRCLSCHVSFLSCRTRLYQEVKGISSLTERHGPRSSEDTCEVLNRPAWFHSAPDLVACKAWRKPGQYPPTYSLLSPSFPILAHLHVLSRITKQSPRCLETAQPRRATSAWSRPTTQMRTPMRTSWRAVSRPCRTRQLLAMPTHPNPAHIQAWCPRAALAAVVADPADRAGADIGVIDGHGATPVWMSRRSMRGWSGGRTRLRPSSSGGRRAADTATTRMRGSKYTTVFSRLPRVCVPPPRRA